MVIKLNPIAVILTGNLEHQVKDELLHFRSKGIEPCHFACGADRCATAITFMGQPIWMAPRQFGIGRSHESEFKPGNDQDVAAVGFGDQLSEDVLSLQTPIGEFLQPSLFRNGAWVVRMAAIPNHRINRVEVQCGKLGYSSLHTTAIPHGGHVICREPDPSDFGVRRRLGTPFDGRSQSEQHSSHQGRGAFDDAPEQQRTAPHRGSAEFDGTRTKA